MEDIEGERERIRENGEQYPKWWLNFRNSSYIVIEGLYAFVCRSVLVFDFEWKHCSLYYEEQREEIFW